MLRTWGGDASLDGTIKEWQKIRELMISQQQMFEHQVLTNAVTLRQHDYDILLIRLATSINVTTRASFTLRP